MLIAYALSQIIYAFLLMYTYPTGRLDVVTFIKSNVQVKHIFTAKCAVRHPSLPASRHNREREYIIYTYKKGKGLYDYNSTSIMVSKHSPASSLLITD